MAKRPSGLPTRPRKALKSKGLFAYAMAGLSKVGDTARRWLDIATGQTISYNKGRERIAAASTSTPDIKAFELALAKSGGNVQYAKKQSGISERKFRAYRKSAPSDINPFVKEKGRYKIATTKGRGGEPRPIVKTRFHTFIGESGLPNYEVGFAGKNLTDWGAWGGPMLIFDVETTTDLVQSVRFGVYQLRGHDYFDLMELAKQHHRNAPRDTLDALKETGLFYNPTTCTPDETITMKTYAAQHGMRFMTMEACLSG